MLLAMSTFPDVETAERVAEQLIAKRLAACANIGAPVQSLYWWKGKIESAREIMVFFKTTGDRFAEFTSALKALHPYEVPEIICVTVSDGSPDYLRWVEESCAPEVAI